MVKSIDTTDPVQRRSTLVRQMVVVLPGFGRWASTIREFETPYGHAGIRQLEVLYILRHQLLPSDEISATSLAEHLQIQRSVVTRILVKLETGGYIVRTPDPRDGRAQQISLTELGRNLSDYVEQEFFSEMSGAVGDLTEDDLQAMERAMLILRRSAERLGIMGAEQRLSALEE